MKLVPGSHFEFADASKHRAELFFLLYFLMTGLHALHPAIGLGVIGTILFLVFFNKVNKERYMPGGSGLNGLALR